jgi:antitoxin FitA
MKPYQNLSGETMTTNFTIKNIPEDLYKKVRERAERNHRSINREIISIISAAMASRHSSADEILARARAVRAQTGGFLTDDFINQAKREGRP